MRRQIATLRTESDTAISAVNTQLGAQSHALKELADAANGTSDKMQELEDQVKKLSGQVKTLSEKCIDLEGRSKQQNLRVAKWPKTERVCDSAVERSVEPHRCPSYRPSP